MAPVTEQAEDVPFGTAADRLTGRHQEGGRGDNRRDGHVPADSQRGDAFIQPVLDAWISAAGSSGSGQPRSVQTPGHVNDDPLGTRRLRRGDHG